MNSRAMVSSILGLCFWAIFLSKIQLGFAQNGTIPKNYITWDDLKVDESKYSVVKSQVNGSQNLSRIIVVDQNGKGDSVTVQGAVDMVSAGNSQRVKIYIHPGIYREKVTVPIIKPYISLIGKQSQSSNTVITWNDKASDRNPDGSELGTYGSATISVFSDYFCASEITFQNTVVAVAGESGMQAVALRIAAEKAMFYRVRVLGAQDTLLDDTGSHYFYRCFIQGSIDFIFGNARSLYQESVLHSIAKGSGAIAAHHRNSLDENTGFSFLKCAINGTGNIYLGRAWGPYSTAVYSLCSMDDIIDPVGWNDWNFSSRQKTAKFGEYQNRGKGADGSRRASWARNYSYEEAKPFLDVKFIDGHKWLRL